MSIFTAEELKLQKEYFPGTCGDCGVRNVNVRECTFCDVLTCYGCHYSCFFCGVDEQYCIKCFKKYIKFCDVLGRYKCSSCKPIHC